jgi:hypothetical protein
LCGTGVTSSIELTFNPIACTARIADSRPGPGPFINKSTSFKPISIAFFKAFSVARRDAKGVLLREPLNPTAPALDQATVFPWWSVTVMIVLLNVE